MGPGYISKDQRQIIKNQQTYHCLTQENCKNDKSQTRERRPQSP
jgi:hypothetical protein